MTIMMFKENSKAAFQALVIGSLLCLMPTAASYADEASKTQRVLSLSARAVIKVEPDSVLINTGITTIAKTAQQSLAQNSQKMGQIIKTLQQAGLKPEHIQTTNFSVGPHYSRTRNSGNQSVITGFQVRNSVRIEVKNIASLGEILDQVVRLGANRINSISFKVEETPALKDKVRKKVMEKIKLKAAFYAQNMGVSLGEILSISESTAAHRPSPYMRSFAADSPVAMSVPIAAGKGSMSSTIHVVWAIK